MASLPEFEDFITSIGEKVLDEFQYHGLTIREWADNIMNDHEKYVIRAAWRPGRARDEEGKIIYYCTRCDFEVRVFPYNVAKWRANERYCPHCGAIMDGD